VKARADGFPSVLKVVAKGSPFRRLPVTAHAFNTPPGFYNSPLFLPQMGKKVLLLGMIL
jgi:hypothetical protein